jgi:AraC family transcriptional regulator
MVESGAYGERMAGYLHLSQPPLYAKLGSDHSELSVTRLHAPEGFSEPTSSIPVEKAFSIHLHLRATSGGRLWLGGKLIPTPKRPSGGVTILDLEEDPIAFFPNPIDVVQFYIPRMALEEFAYENKLPVIDRLQWPHCTMDMVLKQLGLTVLLAIQSSQPPTKLFLDYVGLAALTHAAHIYGAVRSSTPPDQKTLSPWQARRAKDVLMANLKGNITVAALAGECGLSTSHFARAFRRTFGRPPHRWLVDRRIDQVKTLLLNSQASLADIALSSGYADQSALNRAFTQVAGQSPGEWRKSKRGHSRAVEAKTLV